MVKVLCYNSEGCWFDDWLRKWDSYPRSVNPPYPGMAQAALGYLRAYIADAAYIPSRGTTDSATGYKAKMYSILRKIGSSDPHSSGDKDPKIVAAARLGTDMRQPTVDANI